MASRNAGFKLFMPHSVLGLSFTKIVPLPTFCCQMSYDHSISECLLSTDFHASWTWQRTAQQTLGQWLNWTWDISGWLAILHFAADSPNNCTANSNPIEVPRQDYASLKRHADKFSHRWWRSKVAMSKFISLISWGRSTSISNVDKFYLLDGLLFNLCSKY